MVWVGYVAFCGALFTSYFFSVTQSYGKGRSGSSRHVRKPMVGFENLMTSETADVQPFVLVQINFVVRRRHCELVITRCIAVGTE